MKSAFSKMGRGGGASGEISRKSLREKKGGGAAGKGRRGVNTRIKLAFLTGLWF